MLGCHGINAGKVTAAAWMSPGRQGEPAFSILGLVMVIYPSIRKEGAGWKVLRGINDDLDLLPLLEGLCSTWHTGPGCVATTWDGGLESRSLHLHHWSKETIVFSLWRATEEEDGGGKQQPWASSADGVTPVSRGQKAGHGVCDEQWL